LPGETLDDRIVVFFDAPLAEADVEAFEPLLFEPAVPGTFRIEDHFVAFTPSRPVSEWTVAVRVNPELKSVDSRPAPADWERAFTSVAFEPIGFQQSASSEETITVDVRYPVAVNSAEVLAQAHATGADNSTLEIRALESESPDSVRLEVTGANRWPATLRLPEGIQDATGTLTQTFDRTFTFPQQQPLHVYDLYWESENRRNPSVGIRFSERVASDQVAEHITLIRSRSGEAAPFTLREAGAHELHILDVELTDRLARNDGFRVQVNDQLAGVFGGQMAQAASVDLMLENRPFLLADTWWQQQGRDGLGLALNFTERVSAEKLRERLEIIPELPNMRVNQSYGHAVQILGDWESKRNYEIRIRAGMERPGGETTQEPLTARVRVDEVPKYLGFNFPGQYYFPRVQDASLAIESRNVRSAELKLHRMFPSNVAVALNALNEGEGGRYFADSWSELIETKTQPLRFEIDKLNETVVPLSDLLPDSRTGLFNVEATGDAWTYGSKLVLMTNIGLLTHWQGGALVLFAHDLYSMAALDGARVTVHSDKNQVLGQATTDANGIARLADFDNALGNPTVAVVERGDDYTFVELTARADTLAEVTTDMPGYDAERYDAFVYADRELYRPGETAHLRWLVRQHYGDAAANVPMKFVVTKPNGRTLLERAVTLSELGSGGTDLETRSDFPTGNVYGTAPSAGQQATRGRIRVQN
jgi:hypothetical protein